MRRITKTSTNAQIDHRREDLRRAYNLVHPPIPINTPPSPCLINARVQPIMYRYSIAFSNLCQCCALLYFTSSPSPEIKDNGWSAPLVPVNSS